jgi:2-dehydro-3-deoxyphosphogalactonate aldolase
MNFLDALTQCPLVAILRGIGPEEIETVSDALVACGFRIIEVPLNSPDPFTSIRLLGERHGNRILAGAGTVMNPDQVDQVARAGGRLIVMPHADGRIVRAAKQSSMVALPGFATPTEAFAMLEAGADGLKLFPAEGNPPPVLKAMRAVLPRATPVLPVGGITPLNMSEYWKAGASGFGLGSALYKPGTAPAEIHSRAQEFLRAVRLFHSQQGEAQQ